MTEAKALLLVCVAALLLEAIGILGLAGLGVDGIGLGLGAVVPMVFAADGATRVIMHYGKSGRRRR